MIEDLIKPSEKFTIRLHLLEKTYDSIEPIKRFIT